MMTKINWNVVRAIVKRDLRMYFSNPTGYVFITLFIFLSAAAAFWQDRFFLNNLANLDTLNSVFPYLLVFFVPALTMSVWAEERKLGTDELLFTLPATDLEVVLGKYLAVLSIYTVSLVLSLSHVVVLLFLGRPDLGLMFANYVGFWLLGAALIAVGMLASQLTTNVTIAFIVGALLCGILVFLAPMARIFSEGFARLVEPLGVFPHFEDFGSGVVSLTGLLYFLAVGGFFLYINVLLVSRRHWPRESEGLSMSTHQIIRAASVAVIALSVIALVSRFGFRLDTTAEQLHSLSGETRRLLHEIDPKRPVFVQAYISPTVPEPYVQTRANVVGLLKEMSSVSGSKVQVFLHDTEPFSEEAREAREKFGIQSRQVPNMEGARAGFTDVFLGVAFTCGPEEQVIDFFDRGLPTEYEIARSIRVVANAERKKIGVVTTQLRLFGGLDFNTMQSTPPWSVVDELKKQYEVVQLNPKSPLTEKVDGVLVVLPSSLTQEEMDNLLAFIKAGNPALILDDPLPVVNLGLAPSEENGAGMNPFMRQGQPPPEPKGDIRSFLEALGIRWDPSIITWDSYNPHPDLAHLPPEVVFLGRGNQNPDVFNTTTPETSGLQQVVLLYPGAVDSAGKEGISYKPLLETGQFSGRFPYFQMVQRNFLGASLNRNLPHRPDGTSYTLAAEVQGAASKPPEATKEDPTKAAGKDDAKGEDGSKDAKPAEAKPLHAIFVSDVDFISEQFFEIRKLGPGNLDFDNVTFFLNAMDDLVGDNSFIGLRNRRVRHRTLARVEDQTQAYIEQRTKDEQTAEQKAQEALDAAQRRLDERVGEVRNRADLDQQTKQIMARNLQEVENRKFEVLKANIESEKEAEVRASEQKMETQIRRIQSGIRTSAVLLPPIPVFLLGVFIFIRRQKRAREGAIAARRLRPQDPVKRSNETSAAEGGA
jgi:gliding motility-associated transport system permease protein/gliding motility-associatede transport system auxiliary component